mgnify:FL=1
MFVATVFVKKTKKTAVKTVNARKDMPVKKTVALQKMRAVKISIALIRIPAQQTYVTENQKNVLTKIEMAAE